MPENPGEHGRSLSASPQRDEPRRRRLRRAVPPLSVMPTLITLGNLVAGFTAIQFALRPIETPGPFGWSTLTFAGVLIFLGMFLDAIDGSVARLTRTQSEIGAQLDSLCDLVTFGVAPACMMWQVVSHYHGADAILIISARADDTFAKIAWGVAVIYTCCAALRLARFNVETPSAAVEDHLVFRGLPTPGAAGAVASLVIVHQHWLHKVDPVAPSEAFARWSALGIPAVTLLCGFAMVSSIPYVHFMNRYVGGRRSFGYVARILVPSILALILFMQETLAVAFTIYATYSPLRLLVLRLRRRQEPNSGDPDAG